MDGRNLIRKFREPFYSQYFGPYGSKGMTICVIHLILIWRSYVNLSKQGLFFGVKSNSQEMYYSIIDFISNLNQVRLCLGGRGAV